DDLPVGTCDVPTGKTRDTNLGPFNCVATRFEHRCEVNMPWMRHATGWEQHACRFACSQCEGFRPSSSGAGCAIRHNCRTITPMPHKTSVHGGQRAADDSPA